MKKILTTSLIFASLLTIDANARSSIRYSGYPAHYDYQETKNNNLKNIAISALIISGFSLLVVAATSCGHKSTGDAGYDKYLEQKGQI